MEDTRAWKTTKDVLNDIAQVQGVLYTGFNEDFIITGERPPPPRSDYEQDDEMNLRFGVYGNGDQDGNNNSEGPDLVGITQCIRLAEASEMQQYDQLHEKDVSDKASKTKIVISKLNPEVQEFVPKSIPSTNNEPRNLSLDCINGKKGKHSPETVEELPKTSNDDATRTSNPNSWKQKRSQESSKASHGTGRNGAGDCERVIYKETKDSQYATQDEIKALDSDVQMNSKEDKNKMIAMLREQIGKISKDSSFDKRKDRNVAIAALIKVNTIPSLASNLTSGSPSLKPTLLTPDYFKGTSTLENLDAQHQENLVPPPRMSPPKVLEVHTSKIIENVEGNVFEENITPKTEVTPVRTPIDPYMQESINKVNDWFDSPPKPKPAKPNQGATSDTSKLKPSEPYLGTCMFKKKSVLDRNSFKSDISVSKSPVLTTPSYVPSKHAQDLVKKYEKHQVKEMPMDIWTKLERDLKIKDKEIKLRMIERETQNNSNNASSSRTQ